MVPVLFKIGPVTLYSFGLMVAVGFLVSCFWLLRVSREQGTDPNLILDLALGLFVSGLIGARLLFILLNLQWYRAHPLEILQIHRGGLVVYGGVALALCFALFFTRWRRLAFWGVMDLIVPFWVLAQAFGRVGCFLNGCCYGRPSSLFFAVQFPGSAVPIHATQLYESLGLFLLFVGLRLSSRRSLREGSIFGLYLVGYGLLRFSVDFFRGDQLWYFLGLTLAQWMSAISLIAGLGIVTLRPQGKKRGACSEGAPNL